LCEILFIKTILLFIFVQKATGKYLMAVFYVGIYIWQIWVCFFPEMRCYYQKKIGSLVKKSSSSENELMAKLF
jgi:hypothetical protein